MIDVLHSNGFTDGRRLARFSLSIIEIRWKRPLLCTALFLMACSSYAKLKILAVRGGGYFGAYPGRIDHARGLPFGLARESAETAKRISEEYLFRHSIHPNQLDVLVANFGPEKVVMGTSYPLDRLEFDPIEHVASVTASD